MDCMLNLKGREGGLVTREVQDSLHLGPVAAGGGCAGGST